MSREQEKCDYIAKLKNEGYVQLPGKEGEYVKIDNGKIMVKFA